MSIITQIQFLYTKEFKYKKKIFHSFLNEKKFILCIERFE